MKFMDIQTSTGILKMSKIVLGTDYFGVNIPEERAFALMDRYLELGGNVIDTARIYGKNPKEPDADKAYSNSEPIVGRWIKSRNCRDRIVLVTKGCHPFFHDLSHRRLDKASIDSDLSMSLRELGTGSVDVYFLHRDDPNRPVGEIMDALDIHVKAGRIRALGASNWSVARIDEANAYARETGKTPFSISQIHWCAAQVPDNLWDDKTIKVMDDAEYEGYRKNNLPVMAFSSQARGYFSKMLSGEPLPQKRMNRYDTEENRRRLEFIRALSQEKGVPASALMLAYITSAPIQGAAIVGCSRLEQLEETMSHADLALMEQERGRMCGK